MLPDPQHVSVHAPVALRKWNDCARSSFCVGVLGLGVQLVRPDDVLGPGVRRVVLHVARLPRSRDPVIEVEF